jgi:hypothetical protein
VVEFNQIMEMIKSEFLQLESKLNWIKFQILDTSQYFSHNFHLKYWIKVIPTELES